jgi:hypothetical protein
LHEGDAEHRRREHDAIEPALAAGDGTQQNGGAHGMGEREDRRRTIRQHDLAHEGFEVGVELREAADIALIAIAQCAIGQALPAPVEDRHRETAIAQVAHGLEIFLDPFGAAGKQADGAAAAGGRREARKPQGDAVRRFQHAGDGVLGDRIGGNGDEFHRQVRSERSDAYSSTQRVSRLGKKPLLCSGSLTHVTYELDQHEVFETSKYSSCFDRS